MKSQRNCTLHPNVRLVAPDKLISLRLRCNHTQEFAAKFLYVTKRTYQNWEYELTNISESIYEYYEVKAMLLGIIPHDQTAIDILKKKWNEEIKEYGQI
jgi:DNA-binding XRE family transcriptional regulator